MLGILSIGQIFLCLNSNIENVEGTAPLPHFNAHVLINKAVVMVCQRSKLLWNLTSGCLVPKNVGSMAPTTSTHVLIGMAVVMVGQRLGQGQTLSRLRSADQQ